MPVLALDAVPPTVGHDLVSALAEQPGVRLARYGERVDAVVRGIAGPDDLDRAAPDGVSSLVLLMPSVEAALPATLADEAAARAAVRRLALKCAPGLRVNGATGPGTPADLARVVRFLAGTPGVTGELVVLQRRGTAAPTGDRTVTPYQQVFVRGVELDAHIGAYRHERGSAQRVRLDVTMLVRDEGPPAEDRLSAAVDYDRVVREARHILARRHTVLVETAAEEIARACLADPRVVSAHVALEKREVYGFGAGAGVRILRTAAPPS